METPDVGIPPRLAERMSMAEQYEYLWSAHRRARPSRRRALGAGALAGSVDFTADPPSDGGSAVSRL
ncbi:hypothetical protein ABT136_18615 [Streptomyces sp. NPDC001856]|uniref:hypothetical protein n=1 Tax=Streptomyces sp. NPDC001856 TaxID=3154399 RepID=UPI0033174EAC